MYIVLTTISYYRHVQEVLPILPNSYDREFHLLHDCSRDTQKAWHVALYGAVGMSMPSQYSALFLNGGHVKTQDRLIGLAREPASSRSLKNNIVLFQICLLMAVEADARGPKNLRYRNGPIPKGVWLDSALFLGTQIIKTTGRFNAHQKSDAYEDSDGNIARRLWIVLIIMIRMHSVSVGAFDQTHGCEIGSPEDKKILPKSTYDLAGMFPPKLQINNHNIPLSIPCNKQTTDDQISSVWVFARHARGIHQESGSQHTQIRIPGDRHEGTSSNSCKPHEVHTDHHERAKRQIDRI